VNNPLPGAPVLVGQSVIADLHDVSPKTIQTWDKQGHRDARVGELYDVKRSIAWRVAREKGDDPKERAQLRKLEAEARRVELQVRVEEGSLVPVAVHLSRLRTILERLRARLSAAPGGWAPRLVGLKSVPAALTVVRELVNELLTALNASMDEIMPPNEGADAGDRAA
jgi:hypothetical protein